MFFRLVPLHPSTCLTVLKARSWATVQRFVQTLCLEFLFICMGLSILAGRHLMALRTRVVQVALVHSVRRPPTQLRTRLPAREISCETHCEGSAPGSGILQCIATSRF